MKSKIIVSTVLALLFTGCATTSPVGGALYSDVMGPVATTHLAKGPLKGESCATSWLGMFATGDASISESAKTGGMNVVSHVDHHSSNIWFIKNTYCTVTYGYKTATK